mmetsp:Transcript_71385/g.149173  ORF Transcript_71385/g.149173 Transcript_71385/m.149173 type:complete len:293 (-) Transcript_71385:389-1267(-)
MSGQQLVQQAQQKLQGGGFLSFLTGGPKYDEAQDLYQQAANQYKLAKDWQQAAECFVQCAHCAQKQGSQNDEANFLMEAGHVLKKISSSQAVEQYEKAINIHSAGGRFQNAGKLLLQIAELLENERSSHKETKDYYKRAAEMFELDEFGKTSFTKCQLKYAEFAAKDGDFEEAIRIFESEGEKALSNTVMQFNAKEHFFKAGILHLAQGDPVSVNLAVEKYGSLDPRFSSSREGELLAALAQAFETQDVDMFVEKLHDYDSISKLDPWKTEFLLKVKTSMDSPPAAAEIDLS